MGHERGVMKGDGEEREVLGGVGPRDEWDGDGERHGVWGA